MKTKNAARPISKLVSKGERKVDKIKGRQKEGNGSGKKRGMKKREKDRKKRKKIPRKKKILKERARKYRGVV